jgi:hypothetical protein
MTNKNQTAETILIVLKRIILWALIGFSGLILLFFIFIYSFRINFDDYKSLKVITELNGITLDETLSDFLFKNEGYKKGEFVFLDSDYYENERNSVSFKHQKVRSITDNCQSVRVSELGTNGIICEDPSEKILSKYKEKVKILCGNDNSRLIMSAEHNVAYTLKKNKVVQVTVEKNISHDSSWVDCKDYKIK